MIEGTFGERVKELRGRRGWSLRQLASRAGISHNQVRLIETGGSNPSVETAEALAGALEAPLHQLMGAEAFEDDHLDAESLDFVREWRALSVDDRGVVWDLVRLIRIRRRGKRAGRILGDVEEEKLRDLVAG